jgi:crossover junction endodeoxyribonuclease RusA
MTAYEFTLPYPPSANRYWRMPRALGRPILSQEARVYKHEAGWEAKRQGVRLLAGDIEVRIHAYRPRRSGDLDNLAKVAMDALNGIAWTDDSQIIAIEMRRFEDSQNPRLIVRVSQQQGDPNGQHP